MRHDYNLPFKWDSMTDIEKSRWYTQERCRRQALKQANKIYGRDTGERDKLKRKLKARGHVSLVDNR